jgi:hypothetical protein
MPGDSAERYDIQVEVLLNEANAVRRVGHQPLD